MHPLDVASKPDINRSSIGTARERGIREGCLFEKGPPDAGKCSPHSHEQRRECDVAKAKHDVANKDEPRGAISSHDLLADTHRAQR